MTDAVVAKTFNRWVDDRELQTIGTNHGSRPVAFQGWQKFKEAFAPELVLRAISECERPVQKVLDPFGGSGTTGLASQFLGLDSTLIEVNPYLADLIEAKLTHYDLESLRSDAVNITRSILQLVNLDDELKARGNAVSGSLPPTFVEPGVNSRWIFSRQLGGLISATLEQISKVANPKHQRLFRIAVGGVLVTVSNVRVSGKGRRYRSGWQGREVEPGTAARIMIKAIESAISDIETFQPRQTDRFELIRGDARQTLSEITDVDVAVFSPPYPNSFDYTDVYNVELWMLGYLSNSDDNRSLRASTLTSHVQILRDFAPAPSGSTIMAATLQALEAQREDLWDKRLPLMVGAYFAEMVGILEGIGKSLNDCGEVWMVVGDSRYSGIDIRVADILVQLAQSTGFETISQEPFRSMRASPQQGGALELAESLIVLRKLAEL